MMVWDLDLTDPQFPSFLAEVFQPQKRLPLYFCTRCGACSYRLSSEERIQCFSPDCDAESPFQELAPQLRRQRIAFAQLPTDIDALLTLEDTVGLEWLDEEARGRLQTFLGKRISSSWDIPFSQWGGQPLFVQGHFMLRCPNPKCPTRRFEQPYGPYALKELAVVEGDADLELKKVCSQMAFHVCCVCLAIHAQSRCS